MITSGYQRTFSKYGIDIDMGPEERVAELIRAKPQGIREALVAALDDWVWHAGGDGSLRLRYIVRGADRDPWRNAIRDAVVEGDTAALRQRAHDPDVARQPAATLHRLGNALVQAHEFDEAVALLRQAQYLYPHDFWINHDLAQAFSSSEPAQYDEAIRFLTAAVALRPDSPGVNFNLGLDLKRKGQIDEAIVYYGEAIRLDPKYAMAYSDRGNAWYRRHEHDKAIADYNKAIELDPKFAWAYNNRGNVWLDRQEYDKASADYNKAIELDPKYAMAYSNRGRIWYRRHELDKAITDYDKAIGLDPKFAMAYDNRGLAWCAKREYDKAIADHDKAIGLDPKLRPGVRRTWQRLVRQGGVRQGDRRLRQGDRTRSQVRQGVQTTAATPGAAKEEYDKAIADYNKAIEIDPKFSFRKFGGGSRAARGVKFPPANRS